MKPFYYCLSSTGLVAIAVALANEQAGPPRIADLLKPGTKEVLVAAAPFSALPREGHWTLVADTVPAAPEPDKDARIAELEAQVASLEAQLATAQSEGKKSKDKPA